MQDDHPTENDGEKKPGSFQFSLRSLFLGVTLSTLVAASFANGLLLPPFDMSLLLFLIAAAALCGTDFLLFLAGWKPQNRFRAEMAAIIVFNAIWILSYLYADKLLPNVQ